jgi:hypothetical protein
MKTLIRRRCNFCVSSPNLSELMDDAIEKDKIRNPSLTAYDYWPELERILDKHQWECGKPAFYRLADYRMFYCEEHYQVVKNRRIDASFEEIGGSNE